MPRKPNYKFERFERERAKGAKKAARLQAKADRRSARKNEDLATGDTDDETAASDVTAGTDMEND